MEVPVAALGITLEVGDLLDAFGAGLATLTGLASAYDNGQMMNFPAAEAALIGTLGGVGLSFGGVFSLYEGLISIR